MPRPRKFSNEITGALGQLHADHEAKAVFGLVQRHQLTVQAARELIAVTDHERSVLESLFPTEKVLRFVEFRQRILCEFDGLLDKGAK